MNVLYKCVCISVWLRIYIGLRVYTTFCSGEIDVIVRESRLEHVEQVFPLGPGRMCESHASAVNANTHAATLVIGVVYASLIVLFACASSEASFEFFFVKYWESCVRRVFTLCLCSKIVGTVFIAPRQLILVLARHRLLELISSTTP